MGAMRAQSADSKYDSGTTVFSPKGRLYHVEYAAKTSLYGKTEACGSDQHRRSVVLCSLKTIHKKRVRMGDQRVKIRRVDSHRVHLRVACRRRHVPRARLQGPSPPSRRWRQGKRVVIHGGPPAGADPDLAGEEHDDGVAGDGGCSSGGGNIPLSQVCLDERATTTAQAGSNGTIDFKELESLKKVSAERSAGQSNSTNFVSTALKEETKSRLQEEMQTRVQEVLDGPGDIFETIFEFENHAYTCRPTEEGGSVFEPSSYTCAATSCELTLGDPTSPIGDFHVELVNNLLPTLHAVRSLKTAMAGRNNIGEEVNDPIGGIAFVFNVLHQSDNPVCALAENEELDSLATLFEDMEDLLQLLRKVPLTPIQTISKLLLPAFKSMNGNINRVRGELEETCDKTTEVHETLLELVEGVRGTLTTLDQITSFMLPPTVEATCVSDNTFTLADELLAGIEGREAKGDDALTASTPADELLADIVEREEIGDDAPTASRRPLSTMRSLPKTGDLTPYIRRHFAASMTPHPRDLPIRRALMYSDWERRSSAGGEAAEDGPDFTQAGDATRSLGVSDDATDLATGIIGGALGSMNFFLERFAELDRLFRIFGQAWVDVSLVTEEFFNAVVVLFEDLEPFLGFFDVLSKVADTFQSLKCPKIIGFVCQIADLLADAVGEIFEPFTDTFEEVVEDILSVLTLPATDFTFPDLLPDPLPWEPVMGELRDAADKLVLNVVEKFIEDPLPLLYEPNTSDLSGLDILYAGKRADTKVALNDCNSVYENDGSDVSRLPFLFRGTQSSAFCPLGSDFTATSLFPCKGFGGVPAAFGPDCFLSSAGKVPDVCISGNNYPPDLLDENGNAHYACAKDTTVADLGALPEEIVAVQGRGQLSCSLGRYAVDFAEAGEPCRFEAFRQDPSLTDTLSGFEGGCDPPFDGKDERTTDGNNCDACSDIDVDVLGPDSPLYISPLASYLELVNVQSAEHTACDGDHLCLARVWNDEENVKQTLVDLVPAEIQHWGDLVDTMAVKHLDLYEWGTSNPILSELVSYSENSGSVPDFHKLGLDETSSADPTIGGIATSSLLDHRTHVVIQCGSGSYLEYLEFIHRRASTTGSPIVTDDIADVSFSCYGDRANRTEVTLLESKARGDDADKFDSNIVNEGQYKMDCRGARGGFRRFDIYRAPRETDFFDNEEWGWKWECLDGTTGQGGPQFEANVMTGASCGEGKVPITRFEQYWQKEIVQGEQAHNDFLILVACQSTRSPFEKARDLSDSALAGFSPDTAAAKYLSRRNAQVAGFVPDVERCERVAIDFVAAVNDEPLADVLTTVPLPPTCDAANVRYYCPVPGIDTELPAPERVAISFGDTNLKDALVECPDGLTYMPLDVTQGVPPFDFDPDPLTDFVNAGCDGSTSSCVYTSPEGKSARVTYQCVCGEGFTPLPNESGECELCPVGTQRPFVTPDDDSPPVLADSCLACPEGTYGDPEAPVPTCRPCPKNTYSDKVGGVGLDACTPCLAGFYTEEDAGGSSVGACVECGQNFECPLFGERAPCPVGFWTNGDTDAASCVGCPPGTFYPNNTAGVTCTACPSGTFNDGYAQTECTPCPAGSFGRDSGADTCEVCPQGTFQDQEGTTICQECDSATPFTATVNTTSAAGCFGETTPTVRTAVDVAIRGSVTVEATGGAPAVGFLRTSLLAWASDWATDVVPGKNVTIDRTTVVEGDVQGQFVLSFKANARDLLASEAQELVHRTSYPEIAVDMTTTVAQLVREDPAAKDVTLSPEPVSELINASVVANREALMPLELVDFEHPDLASLTCEDLLTRFVANPADALLEVGDGFCNGGVWNAPQCNYDGGDCCSTTCDPVSLSELASTRTTSALDCILDAIGDGYCDFENNNEVCAFDGGDCCSGTCFSGAGGDCDEDTFECRDGSEPQSEDAARAQACSSRTMRCVNPAEVEQPLAGACAGVREARALLSADNAGEEPRRLQIDSPPTEEECGSPLAQWGDGVCDARLNTEECKFDGGDCCAQTCVNNALFPESCLFPDCKDPAVVNTEPVTTFDIEPPVLNNLPVQDLDTVVHECVAPTQHYVIASDNDPCFQGGLIVPTDEFLFDDALRGSRLCSFSVVRTWAAEDLAGNSVQAQRTYKVSDTTPPILTGLPADGLFIQTDDPNLVLGEDAAVSAVDACSGLEVAVGYTEDSVPGTNECVRTVTRTWTAEDACGNSVSSTRTIRVEVSPCA
eukprot:g5574.t1